MNTALFATPGLWAPLHGLLRWLTPGTPPTRGRHPTAIGKPHATAINSIAIHAHAARRSSTIPSRVAQRRPLRVVRIMEAGQTPAQVGRMVISGRMADVCAELDRLAACEAARH
jgi:hypothetical protein